jgi:hypothetical protein
LGEASISTEENAHTVLHGRVIFCEIRLKQIIVSGCIVFLNLSNGFWEVKKFEKHCVKELEKNGKFPVVINTLNISPSSASSKPHLHAFTEILHNNNNGFIRLVYINIVNIVRK